MEIFDCWIYDGKVLIVDRASEDDTHALTFLSHPQFFGVSDSELLDFCKSFGFNSVRELQEDYGFIYEESEAWNELMAWALEMGALRVAERYGDHVFIQTYDMKQKRYREAVLNALIDFEFLPSKIGYRIFDFSMETGVSVSNKNDAIDEILDRF